jgi:phage-related minor tail protein
MAMARETLPEVDVRINADTRPFAEAIENLGKLSGAFGNQLTGAMRSAVVSGKSLEDVLRRIGLNMAGMALSQGLQPLSQLTAGLFAKFTAGLAHAMPFGKGGIPGGITPFASGGVVSTPTYFPTGSGLGLMGEAGAEAILPLRRSADGRLGVAAAGGGAPVNVVFNVTTPDAGSFRKSEAQITGMLARAVSRGARTL